MGEIVNFISVDGQRMLEFPIYFNLPFSIPLYTFICMYFLYSIVGVAAFSGLVVIGKLKYIRDIDLLRGNFSLLLAKKNWSNRDMDQLCLSSEE